MQFKMQEFSEFFLKLAFQNKIPTKHQLRNLILRCSDIFTFLDSKRPENYLKSEELLTGYLIYFVPVNLTKVYSILKELFRHPLIFRKKDLKIIDIGSGPAPAIVSFFKLLQDSLISFQYIRYIGVELEEKAIELASKIIENFKPKNLSVNYEFLKADASDSKTYMKLKELKPDIMIFSNSLGEILDNKKLSEEDFLKLVKFFTYKNEDFTLILIEPGTKKSASRLHRLRDRLIKETGFYPYSPCVNNLECPALKEKNWCYEERKWSPPEYLSFLSSKGLQINYLKFSYIVLRKDGLNIKDTFENNETVVKNTSHLLNEKGKSRLWGCWDGSLVDIEKLKRDYLKDDPWLKIRKGCYFTFSSYIGISENKIRIPKNSVIKILYCP